MKIIQLLKTDNDYTWQGRLLGLGDNGITYAADHNGRWEPFIPNVEKEKTEPKDAYISVLENLLNGFISEYCDRDGPEEEPVYFEDQSSDLVREAMELLN